MKLVSATFCLLSLLTAPVASADVLCENTDKTIKIHTFQLSEDTFGLDPIKVAAILKFLGQKTLYTGTVQKLPNRTGNTDVFNLNDEHGAGIGFTTTTYLKYDQCTRVSCNPIIKTIGTLEVAGESHILTCYSPIF